MNTNLDGGAILEQVYAILNQEGEKATDLECAYEILEYLTQTLK